MDGRPGSGRLHSSLEILKKLQMYVVGITRIVLVIINNLYCIPVHLVWLLVLQPLRLVVPDMYWKLEGIFFRWLLSMVALWSYSAGYDVLELGDDVWQLSQDRTVVMYNHQSTSDVPLIMAAFNCRPHFTSSVMWIMDRVFRLTNFGVVSHMHGDFFIRAGKAYRDSSLLSLREHLSTFYQPQGRKWIVLFPEGGFLINRLPTSQKFAQKLGLPHLQHVSLPRSGALKAILDHSHEQPQQQGVKWVVDVTVGYPGGDPLNLQTLFTGWRPRCTTVMHYRCYTADQIPRDEAGLNAWLYARYVEKECMLAQYYDTGHFPDAPQPAYPPPPPLAAADNGGHFKEACLVTQEHKSQFPDKDSEQKETAQHLDESKAELKLDLLNREHVLKSSTSSDTRTTVACACVTPNCVQGSPLDITKTRDTDGVKVRQINNDECVPAHRDCNLSDKHKNDSNSHRCTTLGISEHNSDTNKRCEGNAIDSNIINAADDQPHLRLNSTSVLSSRNRRASESYTVPCVCDQNCCGNIGSQSACVSQMNCVNTARVTACGAALQENKQQVGCTSRLTNGGDANDDCVRDNFNNNSPKHSVSHPFELNNKTQSPAYTVLSKNVSNTTAFQVANVSPASTIATQALYPETHRPALGKLPGVHVKHDPLEFVLRHMFYVVSTYLACSAISYACTTLFRLCC